MINTLIVDDHPIVREGLKQIVRQTFDIAVVGEASDAEEALVKVQQVDCDIVLLDISLPGRSGLDILMDLKQRRRGLRILVLSMYADHAIALKALERGANGYLVKESAPEELVRAIRKLTAGMRYVSEPIADRLVAVFQKKWPGALHENLSGREHEVMCLIARGKTRQEIAEELGISAKTISIYRSRILEKMKMRTNADIARYAVRNALVQ